MDSVCHELSEKAELLLDYLGISYSYRDNYVHMPCPIHGGDNPTACTVYVEGDSLKGNWYCWTHQCHEKYLSTMLGFIRGYLESEKDRKVSFKEAVDFALEFLNTSIEDIQPKSNEDKKRFVTAAQRLQKAQLEPDVKITRDMVKSTLQIPSQYYIDRGYKKETLEKFDVGTCIKKGKPMYGRAVAPVYNDSHEYMVGCTGRQINEKYMPKWRNSPGFKKGLNLYGYWFAKEQIRKTGTVIIVEGQGDVWRLHEAGIKNVVGIFGCSLTDAQIIKLESSGAANMIVLLDNDEAGSKAKNKIRDKCGKIYNLFFPKLNTKDVGDMSISDIHETLVPQIEGMF